MESNARIGSKFKVQSSKFEESELAPLRASVSSCLRAPSFSNFERRTSNFKRSAFTLVEMLVVIAIIALLLAALLPAFSSVRQQAKVTQTAAQFRGLDQGVRSFQAETAIGGSLPPSSGDLYIPPNTPITERQMIADPKLANSSTKVRVSGAHLLVHAMIGADALGTPGFRDISRGSTGRGTWADDTHRSSTPGTEGIYAIGDDGKEKFPRYGGAGYVDEKLKSASRSLQELTNEGKVLPPSGGWGDIAVNERLFLDAWEHPILYYRANASSLRMVGTAAQPGIFWQEDNGIITGSAEGFKDDPGVDFGQGTENNALHAIKSARSPDPSGVADAVALFLSDTQWERTFARYIVDPSAKARLTPVNKDSYLLISAGPDSRYGTADDVVNWTKKTE